VALSELATIVETEARLDREVASARETAASIVEAARHGAADDARKTEEAIAALRTRVAQAVATETETRLRAIAVAARDTCARYAAVRDTRLTAIAQQLARRVAELAEEDA
jgi:vacuolar-type H+-ATPase subunit H